MRAGTTPNGQPRSTALYEAILRLDNLDDCIRFFEDLCAVTELRTMEQRYDVAGCLLQGKVYSEIRQLTGASSATVSRVNRMLNYGTPCTAWCCAAWMTRTLWWQTRWILTVWYRVSSS